MTEDQSFAYLVTWMHNHAGPGKCKQCTFTHSGYQEYVNHLVAEHPEAWEAMQDRFGLNGRWKKSVPQGTGGE